MDAKILALAITTAEAGVDYTNRNGATCPWCGQRRVKVVTTRAWSGQLRIRYHNCQNRECLLCKLKTGIKSVQTA